MLAAAWIAGRSRGQGQAPVLPPWWPKQRWPARFEAKGQAGLDRLKQDKMQQICSEYEGKPVPDELAQQIIGKPSARLPGRWPVLPVAMAVRRSPGRYRIAEQR